MQLKACEFGLEEHILEKGESSTKFTSKEITPAHSCACQWQKRFLAWLFNVQLTTCGE